MGIPACMRREAGTVVFTQRQGHITVEERIQQVPMATAQVIFGEEPSPLPCKMQWQQQAHSDLQHAVLR
jgi:hypothetical protein